MALALADDATVEARRILSARNAFEVLELAPAACCARDAVERAFVAKEKLFKRLVRNDVAVRALQRLRDAKMVLCNDTLRAKELLGLHPENLISTYDRQQLDWIEKRTAQLEERARFARLVMGSQADTAGAGGE
jgi:nucleoside-diphosphate-sugar epimerase